MFLGRTQELRQLNEAYQAERSNAVILYGRYGIGKTELAEVFTKDKMSVFYLGRELSEREQCFSLAKELEFPINSDAEELSVYEVLKHAVELKESAGQKVLVVVDEFHFLVKNGTSFEEAMSRLLIEKNCMFLLLSSSVNWVENTMVDEFARGARLLNGLIKLKEFSFVEMVKRFPEMSVEDSLYASAVLGGVPEYLEYWSQEESTKDNIVRLFLKKNSPLLNGAESFLKKELRELGAYNAILAAMAAGKYKLNDIFARTGFSRAKISVYIKNLIELDVVEKVFSFDSMEHAVLVHANVQKGLYRIKDKYLCFWYRYVFPNLSMVLQGRGEEVFDTEIAPDFAVYMKECFAEVCSEYLKLMAQYGRLQYKYSTFGTWYGKTGCIDVLAKDEEGNVLAGFCQFGDYRMSESHIGQYKELLELALVKPKELVLFSRAGFEPELKQKKDTLISDCKVSFVELADL